MSDVVANWVSLRNRSYYSLLKGSAKPIKLAERAVQLGLPAIALTDEGSITGSISFIKALKETCSCGHHQNSHGEAICYGQAKACPCKEFRKANIKPIIGTEFRLLRKDGEPSATISVLAKNLAGWKSLISATSEANRKENIIEGKPHISFDALAQYAKRGDWIGYAGAAGSEISNSLFTDPRQVYLAESVPAARKLVVGADYNKVLEVAGRYADAFGKENFYLEAELLDRETFPGTQLLTNAVRWISKQTGIGCVATSNTHYAYPDDSDDQRVLLCTGLETDFEGVSSKIAQKGRLDLLNFFKSSNYHLATPKEITDLHEVDEIQNSLRIAEQCEIYNVLNKPDIPKFDCPNGKTADQYLKELCAIGWRSKIEGKVDKAELYKYKERIKEELSIMSGAGLSSYFLIVQDYCKWARENGQLVGPGRGSAGACLIAYLTNITKIDPIYYDLIRERFYNEGRNTAERVSLPDIDVDFSCRDAVIAYVRNRFGRDHVANMVTFARIQGKGAIKEVFRRKFSNIPISEVEKITKALPDPAAIADKLQEMKEAGEEQSIIMWALESNAKELKPFCYIDPEGNLQGEYAVAFKQAIRLEGTKKSQSKHPSGLIISNDRLGDKVPLLYDKTSGELVAGFEMDDISAMGLLKCDILGLSALKKLQNVSSILATGRC